MPSLDPTKTTTLRLRYAKSMNRRFLALSRDVRTSLLRNEALHINEAARSGEFDGETNTERLHAFEAWIGAQMVSVIMESSRLDNTRRRISRHWQNRFLRAAYIRGVTQAETDLRRLGSLFFPLNDIEIAIQLGIHSETLQLMYARAYESLRGIAESLSSQLSQIFSQSLLEGVGIAVIASRLVDQIAKVSKVQAALIASTEPIRAYNEAKLSIFEHNEVASVSTDVEFTIRDSSACPICKAMDGKRFTIAEARGVIPQHPHCRCSWRIAVDEVANAA